MLIICDGKTFKFSRLERVLYYNEDSHYITAVLLELFARFSLCPTIPHVILLFIEKEDV